MKKTSKNFKTKNLTSHRPHHTSANRGITLIALVITIIVMLILVAVTISIAVNGGLFGYAGRAAQDTESKKQEEQDYANLESGMTTDDLIEKYTTYGTTYTAYAVGDTVTIGGESFYVIEASDETKSTVKLLAKNCVDTRREQPVMPDVEYVPTPNANYNKQSDSANTVAFDSTEPYSNVYANSTIKPLVDSYVASLGVTVKEGRLMTKQEVVALGGNIQEHSTEGCPAFINAKNFWIGSPVEGEELHTWRVLGDKSALESFGLVSDNGVFGLRPVIVISKSNI